MDHRNPDVQGDVKSELTEIVSGLLASRDQVQLNSVVPPPKLRWFVLAYLLALIAAVPNEKSSWISMGAFFLASLAGLLAIHFYRKLISSSFRPTPREPTKVLYRIK